MKKRIILMGPPGGGKGTQAKIIEQILNVPHLSTGDMMRAAGKAGTEFGKLAAGYIEKGELVPDDVTIGLINERLSESDCKEGFILDGFPRTLAQAEALTTLMNTRGNEIEAVIYVKVPDEVIIERITGRYTCSKCGAVYHDSFKKPKKEGVCDFCNSTDFIRRPDDNEETVKARLDKYYEMTIPVLNYYKKKNLVSEIDGVGDIDEITKKIEEALR